MPAPPPTSHRDTPRPASGSSALTATLGRYVSLALLGVLTVLLVEVLFESWVQELLGNRVADADGLPVGDLPSWPKALKNGLLIALAALAVAKVALERRWREFRTPADIAIVALAVVMAVAGLLGTSGPVLIGQALFVYLRGAIVFYAVRALRPTWSQVRRVLWVVGSVVALNVAVALVQMVVGRPAFSGLGWVDMSWADTGRAHGLLDHPNHLGHVLGLVLIGLLAFMSGQERVAGRWWLAVLAAGVGLAATQSRESMLAVLVAAAVIWFLRRGGGRAILIAGVLVAVIFAANQLARPGNLDTLIFRIKGVFNATETVAGEEDCEGFKTTRECVEAGRVEAREIRVLFYQQGARLLAHRPVLGYGVGQFGGIVAEQNDPNWELDPRFPGGFKLYDFDGTTVDSFWLHLAVEVGLLGLLVYLAWLWLLIAPLVGATNRFAGRRVIGAGRSRSPTGEPDRAQSVALWGTGVMIFLVLVGFFSPALEDPLFPPLVFAVIGLGWVLAKSGNPAGDGDLGPDGGPARDANHSGPPRPAEPAVDDLGSHRQDPRRSA
ncbi:MAG: O-antigen ligase family protein [Micromonosporaceae bacterium]|nr:O-antigen ligase family protein [Micromonosporaceae bacterium]